LTRVNWLKIALRNSLLPGRADESSRRVILSELWHYQDEISRIMGKSSVTFRLQGTIFLGMLPSITLNKILVKDCRVPIGC
ncbi:hypothetical protein PIB30_109634, partial [Stylosanthes scabra]|nr:hypothetical protein [Stylosanthes scabra]